MNASLSIRVAAILLWMNAVELGTGDFCTAYLVNQAWVFRFAKHPEAAASLQREFQLLPRIADRFDLAIPSPRVFSAGPPAFLGHPLLQGRLGFPEPERQRLAEQVASFLKQMHATDLALARECGIPVLDYRTQYLEVLRRAEAKLYSMLGAADHSFIEHAVSNYLALLDTGNVTPVLLHGDLSPEHVLCREGQTFIAGIIDFGDMAIGDPAWDLVYIYEDYGLDLLRRILSAYAGGNAKPLVERMYRLYVLEAVDWALQCAQAGAQDLDRAVGQIVSLRTTDEEQLVALLSACLP
jgi:aminoglycoside 2''-phosphotransferase